MFLSFWACQFFAKFLRKVTRPNEKFKFSGFKIFGKIEKSNSNVESLKNSLNATLQIFKFQVDFKNITKILKFEFLKN